MGKPKNIKKEKTAGWMKGLQVWIKGLQVFLFYFI
jgi:hypothetical protein